MSNNKLKKDVPINTLLHTSTPKRKLNRSLPTYDTSPGDPNFKSNKQNKIHRSFCNNTCPTLENFIRDDLFSPTKENISINHKLKKKKKNSRSSFSPNRQENTSFDNSNNIKLGKEKNCYENVETKSINVIKYPESGKNIKSRRIKPTILLEQEPKATVIGSNSFSFIHSDSEVIDNVSAWQRSVLQEEKEKIASRSSDSVITVRRNSTRTFTLVSPDQVTHKELLDSLVHIHKTLIDYGYILSLAAELHFILTLLLASGQEDTSCLKNYKDVFDSVHNCVYFAAKVLLSQAPLLSVLNRATLRLLCENVRVQEFVPGLINMLTPSVIHRSADIKYGKLHCVVCLIIYFLCLYFSSLKFMNSLIYALVWRLRVFSFKNNRII